jgi:hypothetical protein
MTPYIPVWLFILDRVNNRIHGLAVIIQNLDTEAATRPVWQDHFCLYHFTGSIGLVRVSIPEVGWLV